MARIQWQEAFDTGIPEVDGQHRKFVGLINRLDDLVGSSAATDPGTVSSIIADLVNYARYHFSTEQDLHQEFGFSETTEHLARHRELLDWLNAKVADTDPRSEAGLSELLSYLMDWFLRHVLVEDMKFGREYARKLQGKENTTTVV